MREVLIVSTKDKPPRDTNHVVIRRTPSGKFRADGSVAGEMSATFYAPPPFDTLESAIAHARHWADENGVPVVHVMEG
jgi:hypothetical protein